MKPIYYISIIIVLIVIGFFYFRHQPVEVTNLQPGISYSTSSVRDLIRVNSPQPGSAISSPVKITGEARGNWYFEASFPIAVVDWDGRIIGEGHAEAQGDWMTSSFVPFIATVEFAKPAGTNMAGAIILKKDNPSGRPDNDGAAEMSVTFK